MNNELRLPILETDVLSLSIRLVLTVKHLNDKINNSGITGEKLEQNLVIVNLLQESKMMIDDMIKLDLQRVDEILDLRLKLILSEKENEKLKKENENLKSNIPC